MTSRARLAGLLGLAAVFTVYAASIAGIRISNEGSHYALVRSLADGTVKIDEHVGYTRFVDLAEKDGHFYSDRAPGTATLAVPLYFAGRIVGGSAAAERGPAPLLEPIAPASSRLRVPPPEEYSASLLAALAGTAIVALAFALALELGAATIPAIFVAAAVGFSTMVWRYSTVLFNHGPAAAVLLATVYMAIRATRTTERRSLVVFGFLAGAGVTIEYALLVPAVAIALAVLVIRRDQGPRSLLADAAAIGLAAAVPLGLLALYHTVAFGAPWRTSYSYKVHEVFAFTRSFTTAFSGPAGSIWPMLFDSSRGIVPWNPLLLMTPFAFVVLFRRDRNAAVLLLIAALPLLVMFAKFQTWDGGPTRDSRYVTPLLPLLIVPVALLLDTRLSSRIGAVARSAFGLLAGAGLLLQGVRLVRFPGRLERFIGGPAIAPSNFTLDLREGIRQFLRAAFPSVRFVLPTLLAGCLVAVVSWRGLRQREANIEVTARSERLPR